MLDPLNSTDAIFAAGDSTPPWPTTPRQPNSPIPNLRRAPSPAPPAPDKGPAAGPYGKEPQIYGQPDPGLISPHEAVGSNGTKFEKPEPYLRVRITGLDRNRRDILIKLDAQVCNGGIRESFRDAHCIQRPTLLILLAQRTGMYRVHILSSSNSTSLLFTATHKPSSLHFLCHKPPRPQTKKMIGLSKSCSRDG